MEIIVECGEFLTGKDRMTIGRILENLGLAGMDSQAIQQFLETGRRE
jgi:hypothetical protein